MYIHVVAYIIRCVHAYSCTSVFIYIYIYMYDHVCRRIHIGDRLPLTGDITYYLLSGVNRHTNVDTLR